MNAPYLPPLYRSEAVAEDLFDTDDTPAPELPSIGRLLARWTALPLSLPLVTALAAALLPW